MKKNNSYITDYEIDLGDFVRILWREKILILSISVIFGLVGYLFEFFEHKESKTQIKLRNPPFQLFDPYTNISTNNSKINYVEQFISDFKLNLLSLDNLETFVEESRDLDAFKKYLKSRNISAKQYFVNKLGAVLKKNTIISNEYFLVFEKKILDGDVFLNNYIEFTKKKIIIEFKKNFKLIIENRINNSQHAFEIAKLINLERPIVEFQYKQNQLPIEPDPLFYKGTQLLSAHIIFNKKLLQDLENDEFNYNPILEKAISLKINTISSYVFFSIGSFIGFILSCIIIFFKSVLKNK
jgi:LPS O-antigen subunit length determinant protein (WzzB/FepE family)